jgi:hypothetical protein
MPPQACQTSQYVVPCGGIFLGKWRSSFAGSSDGKMNVQSACALNTRYNEPYRKINKSFNFICVSFKLEFISQILARIKLALQILMQTQYQI